MTRVDRFLLEGSVHGQTNIADSSGVAELYAINSGCKDGLGVIAFLTDMCMDARLHIKSDSSAARAMVSRVGPSQKTKHLQIRELFVQQLVQQRRVIIQKASSIENIADVGTKHLDKHRLAYLARKLGRAVELKDLFGNPEINSLETVELE